MIKNILAFISVACFVFTLGCDLSSSSSSKDGSNIEASGVVMGINDFSIEPGDLKSYDITGNKRIVYTAATRAVRQRSSCSGFSTVNQNGIAISDTLFVRYDPSKTDFSKSPVVIRAISIEAYREDCLRATGRVITPTLDTNEDCSLCDFIN